MNFFRGYNKNMELNCMPLNKYGQLKAVGDKVRFIGKDFVKKLKTGETATQTFMKYYPFNDSMNKIQTGTIKSISKNIIYKDLDIYTGNYEIELDDGKTIRGNPSSMGCFHDNIFFVIEDSILPSGGKRLRKRTRAHKSRKSHKKRTRKYRK